MWNLLSGTKKSGNVIGGHQRLKILIDLGYAEADCVVVNFDQSREKALNIALNKIHGDWDMPMLKDLLQELNASDINIATTGFDDDELEKLLGKIDLDTEDNFDVDEVIKQIKDPVTKPGDIWLLGKHRLMCGDSTLFADVEKLMGDKKADMVFTDPPYNVNYEGGTKEKLKIKNDKMKDGEFYNFLLSSFLNMFTVTTPGGAVYICHADSEGLNFRKSMNDAGWLIKQCIIWVKNSIVLGRQDYQWKHEPILYGWKPGAAHKWYGDRKQSTVIDFTDDVSIQSIKDDGFIITINSELQSLHIKVPEYEIINISDGSDSTTWYIDKPLKNAEHPTMKPIEISHRAIKNSSQEGDIILDLFAGSGSTLIAAENSKRICYAMELDPIYCDVIINRWERFVGEKAKLEKQSR